MSTYSVIAYRGFELPKEYENLIYAKWLRSFRFGNDYMKLAEPSSYYAAYHRYIENILKTADCTVRLAVLTEDKDVVLGFSVARGATLDYVHVQKEQRRMGIGTSLVPDGIATISHLTKTGLTIWGSKYGHWRFDPF